MNRFPKLRLELRKTLEIAVAAAALTLLPGHGCGGTVVRNSVTTQADVRAQTENARDGALDPKLIEACFKGGDCAPVCEVLARETSGCHVSKIVKCETQFTESAKPEIGLRMKVETQCPAGRRPIGFVQAGSDRGRSGPVGDYMARQAYLESASIDAFEILARELRELGAPSRLIERALRSARQERAHAAAVTELSRSYGATPAAPDIEERPTRTLFEVVLENEVEGCVRETWGALVARWQSGAAHDSTIAAAMASIAPDELEHAELAYDIREWALPLLSERERAEIASARESAVAQVAYEASIEPAPEIARLAGVPTAAVAKTLLDVLLAGLR